jgi:hypothetical protein
MSLRPYGWMKLYFNHKPVIGKAGMGRQCAVGRPVFHLVGDMREPDLFRSDPLRNFKRLSK